MRTTLENLKASENYFRRLAEDDSCSYGESENYRSHAHGIAQAIADLTLQREREANTMKLCEHVEALALDRVRLTAFLTMLQTDFHATPMWEGGAWCIPRLMDGDGGFGGGVVHDRYESFTAAIDAARAAGGKETT